MKPAGNAEAAGNAMEAGLDLGDQSSGTSRPGCYFGVSFFGPPTLEQCS